MTLCIFTIAAYSNMTKINMGPVGEVLNSMLVGNSMD